LLKALILQAWYDLSDYQLEKTLNNINKQLEKKGLKVEAKEGAIVDATVIESGSASGKDFGSGAGRSRRGESEM
jgi:hypothetical protein